MCISILRPNQGKLTDNNSDSGLCSYVEPYRTLQWRRKTPQNASRCLKTPQNTAKHCKLLKPGMVYVATSRAKTIGAVTPNELHPKDSAIFWTGSGICLSRVQNITQKRGLESSRKIAKPTEKCSVFIHRRKKHVEF